MRTDQQHQAGGKRAPSYRQAPIHIQAQAQAQAQGRSQGQGPGRKQAWGKAPTPASGANGTAPPPYRKFHPEDRWKTVHSSSYATHSSSAYREIVDDVKHSDSAMRHAERVRLARMNIALTKLEPAEVAMSIAEQCAPPLYRPLVLPSPPPLTPSALHPFLSTTHMTPEQFTTHPLLF